MSPQTHVLKSYSANGAATEKGWETWNGGAGKGGVGFEGHTWQLVPVLVMVI